ncbi:fungal-specific transcription factor domain-containing protein [Lipomyces tetrasporus]
MEMANDMMIDDVEHNKVAGASTTSTEVTKIRTTVLATALPKKRKKSRKKVDPDKRKRIAVACESCKRRKQKCDGSQPCLICQQKHFQCIYTREVPHSTQPQSSQSAQQETEKERRNSVDNSTSKTAASALQLLEEMSEGGTGNQSSGSINPGTLSTASFTPSTSSSQGKGADLSVNLNDYQVETVGHGHSRLLCDPHGHLRYIGESGPLSFLEQIRNVFRKTIGESEFTLDPDRFRFVDGPNHVASIVPILPPARELADELIQLFVDRVQLLDFVFDMTVFYEQVSLIYQNPMRCSNNWLCLLYLVCAIGAVFANSERRLRTRRDDPEKSNANHAVASKKFMQADPDDLTTGFFESGLGLMKDAAEDGEIWVVQAYSLIAMYYQLICKRNVSWIHLGTAIRLAQALGLHRPVLNSQYPRRDRRLRERLWRTLYIFDRFSSSSLGRPLMIQNSEFEDTGLDEQSDNFGLVSMELAKVMDIVGDVCHFVYGTQSISSSASQELATRLRQWSSELPTHMQLSSSSVSNGSGDVPISTPGPPLQKDESRRSSQVATGFMANSPDRSTTSVSGRPQPKATIAKKRAMRQALLRMHLCHLNGIILLTRPFFFFNVVRDITDKEEESPGVNKAITRLSSACVLCAARSVDLVMVLFVQNEQPSRPPFLIHFIFSAGLILVFEAFHQKSNAESYIKRGISLCMFILDYYATCDPSSLRYKNILMEMDLAVRAAYTAEPERSSHVAQMDQINQLLGNSHNSSSSWSPDPRTAEPDSAGNMVHSSAGSRRLEEGWLFRELGPGGDGNSVTGVHIPVSNISAMFLRAAANDGRYNVSTSAPTIPPAIPLDRQQETVDVNIDTSGNRNLSTSSVVLPHDTEQIRLDLSPSDAMEHFLMDDNFIMNSSSVSSADFNFDLGIDWLNVAVADSNITENRQSNESRNIPTPDVSVIQAIDARGQTNGSDGVAWSGDPLLKGLMLNSEF